LEQFEFDVRLAFVIIIKLSRVSELHVFVKAQKSKQ